MRLVAAAVSQDTPIQAVKLGAKIMLPVSAQQLAAFQRGVLRFYSRAKRDLPWRRTRDPYRILVSEIMLQQTQVERVIPKYRAFLRQFPTVSALARARLRSVLRVWIGLGYNGRAVRLWRSARLIMKKFDGKFPSALGELRTLPGVGPYTAAALASFVFGERTAAIDTNVRRVLSRALLGREAITPAAVATLAHDALPKTDSAVWTQALMDVGALFCRPRPKCVQCPVSRSCAFARGGQQHSCSIVRRPAQPYAGSRRFYRGRILAALSQSAGLNVAELGRQVKPGFGVSDSRWFKQILFGLERDSLIKFDRQRQRVRLP